MKHKTLLWAGIALSANLPPDTFAVTPEQLDEMWPHFEPPGEDELCGTSHES